MKKLVTESLQDYLNEAKVTVKETPKQKAQNAIKKLKADLADLKKPGSLGDSKMSNDAKIKDVQEKIKKWEAKL